MSQDPAFFLQGQVLLLAPVTDHYWKHFPHSGLGSSEGSSCGIGQVTVTAAANQGFTRLIAFHTVGSSASNLNPWTGSTGDATLRAQVPFFLRPSSRCCLTDALGRCARHSVHRHQRSDFDRPWEDGPTKLGGDAFQVHVALHVLGICSCILRAETERRSVVPWAIG